MASTGSAAGLAAELQQVLQYADDVYVANLCIGAFRFLHRGASPCDTDWDVVGSRCGCMARLRYISHTARRG